MTSNAQANDAYPQLTFEARPKHIRDQIKSRLGQFIGGHHASQNLSSALFTHRIDDAAHIQMIYWSAPGRSKPGFDEAKRQLNGRGKKAIKGMEFGPSYKPLAEDQHQAPALLERLRTRSTLVIAVYPYLRTLTDLSLVLPVELDTSGEALIFTPSGEPLHGLTGGYGVERRVEHIIPESARKAGSYEIYVEHSSNGLFGIDNMNPPDDNRYYKLNSADLVVPNLDAWHLMWDFTLLRQMTEALPWDSPVTNRALYIANAIMNEFDPVNLKSLKRCRKIAEGMLGEDWENKIEASRNEGEDKDGTLWGIGHCHIDTAWLWPFSVTQQKSARSWSTQIDLMERYPEHRFSCTQAQQFKWLEQLYPLLYQRLKAKVETGQFQPVGATWVEMDTNLPSGEALCRQFLYGQRYFKSRFGITSPTFVLPDTFGYSSQLPQIARLSGCTNFFTQKLSWNSINSFPHSTFNWVGLDGSQILTHMTPVNEYNAQADVDEIRRGQTGNKNLEVTSQAVILFGNGDGGGGPTPPMLEKLRRTRAVVQCGQATSTDLPLVKMGGSFDRFFESLKEETANGTKLPNWRGELYFELHRGTYTTQALVKRGNRKCELLLREVEYASTMASLESRAFSYPKKDLDDAWEELLLCQFHDCLPGSGIRLIYDDIWSKHHKVMDIGTRLLEDAYQILYPGTKAVSDTKFSPIYDTNQLVVVNPTPLLLRRELVTIKCGNVGSFWQYYNKQTQCGQLLVENDAFAQAEAGVVIDMQNTRSCTLASAVLKLHIKDGRIVSLRDIKLDRELIPHGQTGGFILYEDQPANWDAWDVDVFHLEKFIRLEFSDLTVVEQGPMRASVKAQVNFGGSKLQVTISLDSFTASANETSRSPIRFDVKAEWRERHKFLKFELPLDIHSEYATYHTQFGIVRRPTHRNTSWDAAKFEVCGHQFADLSEYGYGVAILNDSKYGYATEGNVMRLSLLRAPTLPDANADQGAHEFSFAIYPHANAFDESDVVEVAEAFNAPLKVRWGAPGRKPARALPKFKVTGARNVVLETIKRGEDDDFESPHHKTIILRLYERLGGHARALLSIDGLDITRASIVDILEGHVQNLDLRDGSKLDLDFRGFEIKTIKLELGRRRGRADSVTSEDWIRVE